MKALTYLAAALLAAVPAVASAQSPLEGVWRNPKGSVNVRIAPCGPSLCGKVVSANAKAKRGAAEGGTSALVGTTILSNLTPAGPNRWKGRVFMPKQNRHATGNLTLNGRNRLTVQGCLLAVMCKSQTWTRVG